jgi:MFS family permease
VGAFFANPVLLLASIGSGATQFVTYGLGNFAVLFLIREKGMTLNEIALWYAITVAVGMGGGMLISGRVIDRFIRRSRQVYAIGPAVSLAIALPFYVAFVWAPAWPVALVLLTVVMLLNYFYLSASVALVQEEVKPNQRVLSGALLLLVMNFIGLGLGPTFVGWLSTFLTERGVAHSLQFALYALAPAYLIAIFLFLWLGRVLRRDAPLV